MVVHSPFHVARFLLTLVYNSLLHISGSWDSIFIFAIDFNVQPEIEPNRILWIAFSEWIFIHLIAHSINDMSNWRSQCLSFCEHFILYILWLVSIIGKDFVWFEYDFFWKASTFECFKKLQFWLHQMVAMNTAQVKMNEMVNRRLVNFFLLWMKNEILLLFFNKIQFKKTLLTKSSPKTWVQVEKTTFFMIKIRQYA